MLLKNTLPILSHRSLVLLIFLEILFPPRKAQSASWEMIRLLSGPGGMIAASSELDGPPADGSPGRYSPLNLLDGDPATAWVEGKPGPGTGECVFLPAGEKLPVVLCLQNGYQKSESLFRANNRVKRVKVSLYAAFSIPGEETEWVSVYRGKPFSATRVLELPDSMGSIQVPLSFDAGKAAAFAEACRQEFLSDFSGKLEEFSELAGSGVPEPGFQYILKLEILEVYPGSNWGDTCLAGLWTGTREDRGPKPVRIRELFESRDGERVFVRTESGDTLLLADSRQLAAQMDRPGDPASLVLMDVSADTLWAQVDILFGQEGAGRAAEVPLLFYLPGLEWVRDLQGRPAEMYGFEERNGKIFLVTGDGEVDLQELAREMNF